MTTLQAAASPAQIHTHDADDDEEVNLLNHIASN
jgi:hypothetical protein